MAFNVAVHMGFAHHIERRQQPTQRRFALRRPRTRHRGWS